MPRTLRTGVMHNNGNRMFISAVKLLVNTGRKPGVSLAANPPIIAGDLPDGVIGDVVSYQYIVTPVYPGQVVTLALTGALPTGLSMDSAGLVTGTITEVGDFTWSITPSSDCTDGAALPDAATVAGVACGAASTYSGGESFPSQFDVLLGSGTGAITLRFATGPVPDKCEVWFDGAKVIDTGYLGDPAQQSNLDAALAALSLPPETIIPRTGTQTDADLDWAAGEWDVFGFTKATTTTVATVKVYGPIAGTLWNLALSCPGGFV